MAGSFHRNSDVNRLYVKRTEGGRGLKSFEDSLKTRIVALSRDISRDRERNHLLHNVYRHEERGLTRIAKEYEDIYKPRNEEGQTNTREEKISDRVKNKINEENKEQWKTKVQHRHLFRKIDETQTNDTTKYNTWMKE